MRVSDIEARLRTPQATWHQPIRTFVLEGLDEIAGEVRSRFQETKKIPTSGVAYPNVRVTDVAPDRYSGNGYDYGLRGSSFYYGYGDYGLERGRDTYDEVAFEQSEDGTLTLFNSDAATSRRYWRISGVPWWTGMRTLANALNAGTDETATVAGTAPDLYIDLDPTWEYVVITGPDLRVLVEMQDYTRKGDRITFTTEANVSAGDTLNLQVWLAADDVDLVVPRWTVDALEARMRYHIEQATFGTYQGSGTVSAHEVRFGPIHVRSGDSTTSLTRSMSSSVSHPAREYYWRILSQHGSRHSGLA